MVSLSVIVVQVFLQRTTLVIDQTKTLAPKLCLGNSILLPEVVDGLLLLSVDPAFQGGEQNLPRLNDPSHWVSL